jgi:hypothetical protein
MQIRQFFHRRKHSAVLHSTLSNRVPAYAGGGDLGDLAPNEYLVYLRRDALIEPLSTEF